jgi:cell division protein FtsX
MTYLLCYVVAVWIGIFISVLHEINKEAANVLSLFLFVGPTVALVGSVIAYGLLAVLQ